MSARRRTVCWAALAAAAIFGFRLLRGASPEGEQVDEPQAEEEAKPEGRTGTEESAPKLSPEEQYVRDNLEKFLNPTRIEFLEDGRVNLIFNFGEKKEEHAELFTPPIADGARSTFRWALDSEFAMGTWGRSRAAKGYGSATRAPPT